MKALPRPELREFIDRAIVPALVERFLREHRQADDSPKPATPDDRPLAVESRP